MSWFKSLFTIDEDEQDEEKKEVYKQPTRLAYGANPQKWNDVGIYGSPEERSGRYGGYPEISLVLEKKQEEIQKQLQREEKARVEQLNKQGRQSRETPKNDYFKKGGKTKKRRTTNRKSKKNKKLVSKKTTRNKKK
jgi:hypothetical protein